MPVARYVKRDVHALRRIDLRIDFILHPVFRDLLLDDMDIPRVLCAEISPATRDPETTLGSVRAESSIGSADRTSLAKGDAIVLRFGRRLSLFRGSGFLLFLGLYLGVLALDLDRIRLLLLDLRL